MSNIHMIVTNFSSNNLGSNPDLAAAITRAASKQTYYTIRFLVDRELVADAYRAYGYFRWVDDQLDQSGIDARERLIFVDRQKSLVDCSYQGEPLRHLTDEETMLVVLIQNDREERSGLQSYIRNMMAVMAFDAERRGRLISAEELNRYTRDLSIAVTDAMQYFIGHGCKSPEGRARYLAVTGAHITHMLRDTYEDVEAGYYNIPREVVESHQMVSHDVESEPYRNWIKSRVRLARACFKAGRSYLAQVANPRFRMAGYAYIARFMGVLEAIEQDDYHLRAAYPECKSLPAAMGMGWFAIAQTLSFYRQNSLLSNSEIASGGTPSQ